MKQIIVCGALALLVLMLGQGSGRADSSGVDALMARYTQALGGQDALAKIHSSMTVYKCTIRDQMIKLTTTTEVPYYYLQVIEVAGHAGKTSFGFDGRTAWTQTPDGKVKTLTGSERAEVISDAAGANNSEVFPDRWPTTVTVKSAETVDGTSYAVLSIKPKDGAEHELLIDEQTNMPVVDRSTQGNLTVLNVVEAFGRGPLGELQPRIMVSRRSDGAPEITSILREAQDNGPVNKAMFAPPIDTTHSQTV